MMHIPKNWRLKQERYQLRGTEDEQGHVQFPPRPAVRQRLVERYTLTPPTQDAETPQPLHAAAS